MNEEIKRLIEVLNAAGYEVTAFEDKDGVTHDAYHYSGVFDLTVKVSDTSINRSKL